MFTIVGGPSFDSYYFGLGQRITLDKKEGHIASFTETTNVKTYPLKIPTLPKEMPVYTALYKERAVKWFLKNGYVPTVIDEDTKIGLIQESTSEQDLHINALLRKFDRITRVLSKFLRLHVENPYNPIIQTEEYQEWHLFTDRLGLDTFDFNTKIELIFALIEECKQSLCRKEFTLAEGCLKCLHEITNSGFIFKDVYADLLSLQKSPQAADLYLDLSGSKLGEQSALYLEKAIRCDSTNKRLIQLIAEQKCSEARAIHCYVTGYLACQQSPRQLTDRYCKSAEKLNESVKDPVVRLVFAKNKSKDIQASQSVQQAWQHAGRQSASSSPVTSRLGASRTSQGNKEPQIVEPVNEKVSSPMLTMRLRKVSGKILKNLLIKDLNNPELLERLLWWYDGEKKWLKAEYVARSIYESLDDEKEKKYTIGTALARSLEMQDKKNAAVRLYYQLAQSEYAYSRRDNASNCLAEIFRINENFGAFAQQEKQILYLLFLELRSQDTQAIKQLKLLLQNIRSSGKSSARLQRTSMPRDHFGQWAYFQVCHPYYVACVITLTEKFLFTKNMVEITSLDDGKIAVYPLQIPDDVPDEVALFADKTVRLLLSQGFVPKVANNVLTFVDPKCEILDGDAKSELLAKLQNISNDSRVLLESFEKQLISGSRDLAYYFIHKAYTQSKGSVEIADLYAEFLLFVKRPKFALEIFLSLIENKGTDVQVLKVLQRALVAACQCKHDLAETLYNKMLRLLQKMQVSRTRISLLMLHGYLYFECHDPLKEEAKNLFYNKAEGNCDTFLALCATLACQEMSASNCRGIYQKLADKIGSSNVSLTHVYNYYLAKRDLEGDPISPTAQRLALVTPGQEAFDRLFTIKSIQLGPDIILEAPPEVDSIAMYLAKFEEAHGKLIIDDTVQKNSIGTNYSSLGLYFLEHALDLCCKLQDPRVIDAYESIYAKFEKTNAPILLRFLLCLHAFFYLKKQGFEDAAESFFIRAEEYNPTSLLLTCAQIMRLPKWAKLEKMMEYNKVIDICRSEQKLTEYLDSQRTFDDVSFESSLVAPIKLECEKILQQMHLEQIRRVELVVVDAWSQKEHLQLAETLLSRLTLTLERAVTDASPMSFSIHKRAVVLHMKSGKRFALSTALKALKGHYQQVQKHVKERVVTNILDRMELRSDHERKAELLLEGRADSLAQSYFEEAFVHFRDGKRNEAAKSLFALQALPDFALYFNAEETLILQLLQTLLALKSDETVRRLERGFAMIAIQNHK